MWQPDCRRNISLVQMWRMLQGLAAGAVADSAAQPAT